MRTPPVATSLLRANVLSPVVILGLLLSCWQSEAADVRLIQDTWGDPLIEIRGEIKRGDFLKVQRVAASTLNDQNPTRRKALKFHLNTPGGDVTEAMRIGRFFRELLVRVESYGCGYLADSFHQ